MILTSDNYYSNDADIEYMSVSQFKTFNGTYGRIGCEARAMAELHGEWIEKMTTPMLIGSYVDSYIEGSLPQFKELHPEIFKRDGSLKAEFVKADEIIARIERDEFFMSTLSGKKQAIMTGELFGAKWKIKMDSYIEGVAIVDLKVMQSITKHEWVRDLGYLDFIRYWNYDIQGAVYQEINRQNTGKRLPFYIAAVTKETEPDIQVIQVEQSILDEALNSVEMNMPRILEVKSGNAAPDRCEFCDYCKRTKVLHAPITVSMLNMNI